MTSDSRVIPLLDGKRANGAGSARARSASTTANVAEAAALDLHRSSLLFWFVVIEIACQIALLFPPLQAARFVIRTFAFLGSLALVVALQKRVSQPYPSARLALCAMAILFAEMLNPESSDLGAALGVVLLHLAVLGPVFWVPRIRVDLRTVRALFLIFWSFHTASAALGALQAYFPGRFEPALTTVLADDPFLDGLRINLTNGSVIFRPMGLTDSPGGAALGGMYSIIFGTGVLLSRRRMWLRALALGAMLVSLFSIYLCQVRSILVMAALAILAMGVPLAAQRKFGKFTRLVVAVAAVAAVAFTMAVAIGGEAVTNRLLTLIDDDPSTVYYTNRGIFLQHTFSNLLPAYPLGAGLGRWGMMSAYFHVSQPLWAEIQWTGWLFDGGVPLMIVYALCIVAAVVTAFRVAANSELDEELRGWAVTLFGYGAGAVALTFNSCPFESTLGVDFWILNATVFAASVQALASKARTRAPNSLES